MNHGKIPLKTAQGLKVLRQRIAKSKIPSSSLDESINLATWNVRDFGKKKRLDSSLHFIAEIINQFDLVALVELRDNMSDLEKVMKILGPYWKIIFSDVLDDRGGNRERFAYLYDKRAVVPTGLAAEVDGPREKNKETGEYESIVSWWRKPYMVSFRAGSFDFTLIAVHIRWGSGKNARIKPLGLLADWIHKRRGDKHVFDKDIIVMGDFNIPRHGDSLYRAITRKGLKMPASLLKLKGTNIDRKKVYDQILHSPLHKSIVSPNGGVLDFYAGDFKPLFPGLKKKKSDFTYQLSDHLPLWIQLNVDDEEVQLDQILSPVKKRKKKK
ncbi:MAG: endonuclease/exonuclease/phosphatase family protein [FCB group bacterium]|nr:endonuclease/exonuclease/phosphatase family protein [FCB group bacterium]